MNNKITRRFSDQSDNLSGGPSRSKVHLSALAAILLLTASVVATALPAARAAGLDEMLPEPWPFEVSDLEADPSVVWGQLENGLRYVIMPNGEPRERVSLRLFVRAGSLQEEEHQRGLAHYLEHMAFNGTENFAPGSLVEYFQRLGMAFGADTNAYTSFDRTVYMIELPDPEISSIDEGLLVLRDYAGRMLLKEEEVESERGIVLSEMRSRDSVGYRTALAQYAFLFPKSIIPHRFPIGTAEVLRNATREDLADFYDAWYRPERTVVIAVGEVDPDETARLIKHHFGDFEPRVTARDEPRRGEVISSGARAMLHTEMEAPSTRVSIHAVSPGGKQPDTFETRVARLHRLAAAQMLSSRLDTLSRREDAPFSRGSSSVGELFDFAMIASIDITAEPEQWEDALRIAEQELRRALLHGFQPVELREVKADLLNAFEESARRAPTRRSSGLAEEIISSLSNVEVFTSPEAELEMMRPAIEAMTVEDALLALHSAWAVDGRFIFVTGNLAMEEGSRKILEIYEASLAREVEPMEEIVEAIFAYTDFGPAGTIEEKVYVEDLDLHQVRFSNGVRLNVKSTDFQANTVNMLIRIGGGRLTEPFEKQGVAHVASAAFTAGGLGEHSADELRRILAGRNVGISFSVGQDAFQMGGATTPPDLLLQLQLASAYLTDAAYRPEWLRLARNNLRELYRRSRHTPDGVLQAQVSRFLASGDHRLGLPPEEKTMAVELADVKEWLDRPLQEGYLEISLVGDIDAERAIREVAATIGALPQRSLEKEDLTDLRRISFPKDETEKRYTFSSDLPSGYAAVYWPVSDIWDIRETRRMQVLARAFSDRMRVRIREEMGDAYSPFAVSQPSDTFDDYGLFFGLVGIDPERSETVADVVEEIAEDLHLNGVSDDEIERAIRPLLTSIRTVVRDNSYWLNSVMASSQEYPQRLEWPRHMVTDFESIEPAEVSALAARYLAPEKAVRVFVIPESGGGGEG